jgi:hypothetical protein
LAAAAAVVPGAARPRRVQAIDATGMDRIAASQQDAKGMVYTFRAVTTTAVVDCKTDVIFDIHCSMI